MMKNIILFLAVSSMFFSCRKETGCTDPTARNFNPTAQDDDGSCFGSAYSLGYSDTEQSNSQNTGKKEYQFKVMPAPPIDNIFSIYFNDENTGWIAGSGGKVLKTTNGGISWTEYETPFFNTINAICFVDKDFGWIASYEGIAKTTDGGQTWHTQYTATTGQETSGVTFIDKNNGWICGNGGLLMQTKNGGRSWTHQNCNSDGRFYDIFFLNDNNGWAVGSGYNITNYMTNDGGNTWEQVGHSPCPMYSVYFSDIDNGWIAGKNKYEYNSNGNYDGILFEVDSYLRGVHFANNNVGCMVGDNGSIVFTENNGIDWKKIEIRTTNSLRACFFASEKTGFIVGKNSTLIKISLE